MVKEFRIWFHEHEDLFLRKPDAFQMRMKVRWGISNLEKVNEGNSGVADIRNSTLPELEGEIDRLIAEANDFLDSDEVNRQAVFRFVDSSYLFEKDYEIVKLNREMFLEAKEGKPQLLVKRVDDEYEGAAKHYRLEEYYNTAAYKIDASWKTSYSFWSALDFEEGEILNFDHSFWLNDQRDFYYDKQSNRYYTKKELNNQGLNPEDYIYKKVTRRKLVPKDGVIINDTKLDNKSVESIIKKFRSNYANRLKELLIEYYRIKFNPDMSLPETFLQGIGFTPCSICYAHFEDGL